MRIRYNENKETYNSASSKYYWENKEACNLNAKKHYQKNKLKYKENNLRNKHDISFEDFESFLQIQDNQCKIYHCELDNAKNTHIDHCHSSGKIRGILCSNCNTALGKFKDCIEFLQSAIQYIKINKES